MLITWMQWSPPRDNTCCPSALDFEPRPLTQSGTLTHWATGTGSKREGGQSMRFKVHFSVFDMMMLPTQADVPICWPLCENFVIWQRALCSSVSHLIHLPFLPSSSTYVSYLLLPPHLLFQFSIPFSLINSSVPSYSFWTSPFHLLYSSSSILFIFF